MEVGEPQGDSFLWAKRGVAQAAEEGSHLWLGSGRPHPVALTWAALATTAGSRKVPRH
jgi:hypothetical protein